MVVQHILVGLGVGLCRCSHGWPRACKFHSSLQGQAEVAWVGLPLG